jgi:tetratricopeptide (TPR) repeat protein
LPVLLSVAACGPGDRRAQLEPLPEIALGSLQDSFADRIRAQKEQLDQLLVTKGIEDAELAETFGEMGKLLHMSELVEPGRLCYRNAERLAPQDPRWPYYHAHLHHFAGDWDASAERFEQVLSLSPGDLVTILNLGDLFLEQGRLEEAQELFQSAQELGDRSGGALYGLARVYAEQDRAQEAIEQFETVLAIAPDATRIHYHLGVLYGRVGDREKAQRHLALQGPGVPTYPDPLMIEMHKAKHALKVEIAGSVAFREGRFDDALAELRTAEAATPEDYAVQLALGTTLATLERSEEAEPHFRAALRLAETRHMKSIAHLNLANLLVLSGEDKKAAEHYRASMELTPDLAEGQQARFKLALVLIDLDRADEAEPYYRSSLEEGVQQPSTYRELAGKLSARDRFAATRWVLERGRDAHPRDARIANALARLLASCPDDTVRDGATALELAGSLFGAERSGPHAVTLAMAMAENGRFAEATELQQNAIADAEKQGHEEIADRLRTDLALYEQGKPLRRP